MRKQDSMRSPHHLLAQFAPWLLQRLALIANTQG